MTNLVYKKLAITRENSEVREGFVEAFPTLWLQRLGELAELFQKQHLWDGN